MRQLVSRTSTDESSFPGQTSGRWAHCRRHTSFTRSSHCSIFGWAVCITAFWDVQCSAKHLQVSVCITAFCSPQHFPVSTEHHDTFRWALSTTTLSGEHWAPRHFPLSTEHHDTFQWSRRQQCNPVFIRRNITVITSSIRTRFIKPRPRSPWLNAATLVWLRCRPGKDCDCWRPLRSCKRGLGSLRTEGNPNSKQQRLPALWVPLLGTLRAAVAARWVAPRAHGTMAGPPVGRQSLSTSCPVRTRAASRRAPPQGDEVIKPCLHPLTANRMKRSLTDRKGQGTGRQNARHTWQSPATRLAVGGLSNRF